MTDNFRPAPNAPAFALVCAILGAPFVVPSSADAAAIEAEPADIVVTGDRLSDEARKEVEKRPGGVDVVDAADFEDKLAVSLRDVLAFSPGVYTQPRFGQEVRLS